MSDVAKCAIYVCCIYWEAVLNERRKSQFQFTKGYNLFQDNTVIKHIYDLFL